MSSPAEQPIVVQKYGGSSVADVPRIHRVADRVVETVRQGFRVVVVVSAMGNTTSELLALARSVSDNPGRRELDLLVSTGERVSMTLLAMAIADRGVPAASFTGSQSGIITDERHVAARVIEVRPSRIEAALAEGKVAIVAGFQGVSRTREVTTLGRGGSDTTAVVLAAALQAAHCEICSDVDGVYSADPRVVSEARVLDRLPLAGALALSRAGAKVLLADALAFATRHDVTLRAAATHRPPGEGTLLPPGPPPDTVTAVAVDDKLLRYRVADLDTLGTPDAAAAFDGGPRAWWAAPGGDGIEVLIDRRNLHQEEDPPGWARLGAVAVASALGLSVVTDPRVTARAARALPYAERWWASGAVWSALVPAEHADRAQRDLHRALVPSAGSSP